MTTFLDRLQGATRAAGSRLCVGLDPEPTRLPEPFGRAGAQGMADFCLEIARATAPFAAGFKVNLAFFEALGGDGYRALEHVMAELPAGPIVVADGKRGDIGNTTSRYAQAMFERLGVDACTVNPYMGEEALAPFLEHKGRSAFVLAATSNPGARKIQDLDISGEPLYLHVARQSAEVAEGRHGTLGFVVGATRIDALERVAAALPGHPLLVPGVGAQGASMANVAKVLSGVPALINVGRAILYASANSDFAEAAARSAERFARESVS